MPTKRVPHHGGRVHGRQVPRWLVIHDEEFPLSDTSAERIGAYFARADAPGCAHYSHDANSTVISAEPTEVCWHAPPNVGAVGHERDGYASWTAAQWNVPAAQRTTCRTAANMAANAVTYGIPTVLLGVPELRAGRSGFCTHATRSKAHGKSSHSDPGPHFPLGPFMSLVRTAEAWCRDARAFQAAHGLAVDGVVGPATFRAMAPPPPVVILPAPVKVPPIAVDGRWGEQTVRVLQTVLGVKVDGSYGPATKRALQSRLGVRADGVVGPMTVRALQSRLSVSVDGKLGPQTIAALQRRLNTGKL